MTQLERDGEAMADRREAIEDMSEAEAGDLAEACADAAEHFEALMRLCTAAAARRRDVVPICATPGSQP